MATILSSLVGSCAKKLQDIITEEVLQILRVKKDLDELQESMKQIQCYLYDAEQRRVKEESVNNWLGRLRDAMYDADDIIDSARLAAGKLLEDRPSSSRNSRSCSGISFLSCFSNIQQRHEIATKIRNLNTRVEKISKQGSSFLTRSDVAPASQGSTSKLRKSSPLVELNLVGKEIIYSCRKLVDLVVANKEKKAYKLAIVGTGGVGKTTLAQKIYNDQRIKGSFKKHVWICVSQEYNDVTLLKEILRNFGVHEKQGETIAELHSKLEETIKDESFFLVLDDVWQSNVWTNLLEKPLHGAVAGVILVTTRDDTIAKKIGIKHPHRVDLMSEEVGWELLWKSINVDEEKEMENLRGIGIEIVEKCGRLPLAIKVIASVLATKGQTENEWKKILSKSAWSQSKLPPEIEGALYLSYDELPHHLKQCFLYCATYPEDCIMHRDYCIMEWIAEGFVEKKQGQLLEDTAEECYYELIHRNLLEPNGTYFDHQRCKMHDLLRQLACYLSREECFIGDPESLRVTNMSKTRRLTIVTKKDILVLPSMDKGHVKVRTFRADQQPRKVGDIVFVRFPYLRVLILSDSLVQTIPDYIGNLIHLRLLDLDGTGISCLPETIGSLRFLQILNLGRCETLYTLPLAITQLSNLRRLDLKGTPINQVPKGIGRLKLLNDLDGFPIGGGGDNAKTQDGWMLEELGHLSKLRRLDMIKLERAVPCNTNSLLADKKYLKVLTLNCTECTNKSYSEDVCNTEKIFEQLIPPRNLEDLCICGFFGRRYPTWLGTTLLSSVGYLKLVYCNSCVHLPPVGQLPNLKFLKIKGATAVTKIGPEFLGYREDNSRCMEAVAFPKLEWLMLWDMPNWEEWSFTEEEDAAAASTEGREHGAVEIQNGEALSPRLHLLPRLKDLQIIDCPKLRALPRQLVQGATNLKKLQIRGASCLKAVEDLPFLSEMLLIEECDVLERVSNLPKVTDLRVTRCPN